MIPDILILSQAAAENYRSDVPWACISITDKIQKDADIDEHNRVDILRLEFFDLDPSNNITKWLDELNSTEDDLFTDWRAELVLEFVKSNINRIEELVIHCHAGVCRSAGIGAALLKIYTGDDSIVFESNRFQPNMLVYRLLLNKAIDLGMYNPHETP